MQRAVTGNAGIVDQDGNWSKIVLDLANAFLAGVEIADVELVVGDTCALGKRLGGVIITDWFSLAEEPGSQYRVTAYILGRELRTDNIKVALYVKKSNQGRIVTRRGSPTAESKLEDVILAKARDIRSSQFR